MFETRGSTLLVLILLAIALVFCVAFEDKLVEFENDVWELIKNGRTKRKNNSRDPVGHCKS